MAALTLKPGMTVTATDVRRGKTDRGEWQLFCVKNQHNRHTVFVSGNKIIDGLKDGDQVCLTRFMSMKVARREVNNQWQTEATSYWEVDKVGESNNSSSDPEDMELPY